MVWMSHFSTFSEVGHYDDIYATSNLTIYKTNKLLVHVGFVSITYSRYPIYCSRIKALLQLLVWEEFCIDAILRLTFQKMEMRQTLSVSVDWQNGINPARGPLQMGRLFKILKDSSLFAGVSFWQRGSSPARGPLQRSTNLAASSPPAGAGLCWQMGRKKRPWQSGLELRSRNLGDPGEDSGPAEARPTANSNPDRWLLDRYIRRKKNTSYNIIQYLQLWKPWWSQEQGAK